MTKFVYHSKIAQTYEEAEKRFKRAYADDPFNNYDASLLNSANIEDYAKQVGLIFPFDKGENGVNLKTASYGAHVGDKVVIWPTDVRQGAIKKAKMKLSEITSGLVAYINGVSNKTAQEVLKSVTIDLTDGQSVKIPPFSLVYIQSQETFLLPLYIAARFNLRINFVHKGLLLGTGPIVDPGFHGKLLIPLHNLTNNTYEIKRGDKLIWVEFTKTIIHDNWKKDVSDKSNLAKYKPAEPGVFEEAKKRLEPEKYLLNAMQDSGESYHKYSEIKSGIPVSMLEFQKSAEKAEAAARRNTFISGVSLLGVLAAAMGIFFQWYAMNKDHEVRWTQTQKEISDLNTQLSNQDASNKKIETLESELKRLEDILFDIAIDGDKALPEVGNDGKNNPQKR